MMCCCAVRGSEVAFIKGVDFLICFIEDYHFLVEVMTSRRFWDQMYLYELKNRTLYLIDVML